MKNKICLVSNEFPPDTGGAGVVASQILKFVTRHCSSVDFVTQQKSVVNVDSTKVYLHKYKKRNKVWMISLGMLLRSLVKQNYSNIILNDGDAVLAAILFLPKKEFHKVTFFVHGVALINLFKLLGRFFLKSHVDMFISNAKNVVAVSDYMKQYSLDNYDFKGKQINKWYAGIDFSLFSPTQRKKEGIIKVLTVATIKRSKGYFEILDALELLLKSNRIEWHVIGKSVDDEELRTCISDKGVSNNVFIHPPISRGELSELYSVCDVFLLISNTPESFGLVYVEAQYHGLPVLVPPYGGAKESMNNQTGIIIDKITDLENVLGVWKRDMFSRTYIIKHAELFSIEKSGEKFKLFLE